MSKATDASKDKLNITVRIADQPPLTMTIPRADEEKMRRAEYDVNRLWNSWRAKHPSRQPGEVLAMVAFRFAELFEMLNMASEETKKTLADFESELDKILLDVDPQ